MENIKQAYRNIWYGGQDCKMYICVLYNTVTDTEGLDEASVVELENYHCDEPERQVTRYNNITLEGQKNKRYIQCLSK